MPLAELLKAKFRGPQISLGTSGRIDAENGVIYGVKLAEFNVESQAAADAGKGIWTDDQFCRDIVTLGRLSGKVDAFLTHDWTESEADPLHLDLGYWTDFRQDETKSVVADLHLSPGQFREKVLWYAQNNPQGIMASLNFDYTPVERGGKPSADPQELFSADIVKKGAVTNGLFTRQENKTGKFTMLSPEDKTEIAGMISDAIAKAIPAAPPVPAALSDETAAAEMESDAGVTDADKKYEDKKQPAVLRALARAGRALARQSKAIVEEASMKVEASMTAKLGGGPALKDFAKGNNPSALPFVARLSAQLATGVKMDKAILRAKADAPKEFNEWEEKGRPMPAATAA